jgi:hypothetical protein
MWAVRAHSYPHSRPPRGFHPYFREYVNRLTFVVGKTYIICGIFAATAASDALIIGARRPAQAGEPEETA